MCILFIHLLVFSFFFQILFHNGLPDFRNRADRERRFLEQQLKIQEEEENKRKLLLLKEEIIARNQEALATQKEDDIAKNRKDSQIFANIRKWSAACF